MDAHIRRRLRAIIMYQKKRARHLYRHLVAWGASEGAAARTAFSRRGIWRRSNYPGMTQAYPIRWFTERMVTLYLEWCQLNPPTLVSGQQLLFAI